MERNSSRKRPWLAAVLSAVVTGLGHFYLRRWLRAAVWIVAVSVTGAWFVPESTVQAYLSGGQFAWIDIAPVLVVSALSVFDAYRLAARHNFRVRFEERVSNDEVNACPVCGRPTDSDLGFCQWCGTDSPGQTSESDDESRPKG